MPEPDRHLTRRLGALSGAALLVGLTIGSGIFRVPGAVAAGVETVGAIALVWILGGAIGLFGSLTLAELAVLFPRAGGIYVFLREAYGPLPAFLYGWTELLVARPAAVGALATISAEYATVVLPIDPGAARAIAIVAIILVTAANLRSVDLGAALQGATAVAKAVALVVLAGALFLLGDRTGGSLTELPSFAPASWGGFGVALIAVLWAYDGWADTTAMAGEMRDPSRTIPRALLGGILTVIAIYMVVNAAYLWVLSPPEMAASTLVATDAAVRTLGAGGTTLIAGLVSLSAFGALAAAMMTGPRILFALASDGLFFTPVASVHPRFATPWVAILVTGGLGIAYVSVRTFEQLAGAFVLGVWPFYALTVAGVFVLRHTRPELDRPYRTVGYPLVPLGFLLASVLLLGNALVEETGLTLFGFAVILAGVPVYFVWRRARSRLSGR
ncbi:MAG TPA: amino acid permease [Gemmatimonadaceae bacterium]|nr:amino acid permease [Gemmatimonadaceae bacterium]